MPPTKQRQADTDLESMRLLTPEDIQYIFSVGINRAREIMTGETFPSIRIGRRLYVSRPALEEWIELYAGKEFAL